MSFGGAWRMWEKPPSLQRIVTRNRYLVFIGTFPAPVMLLELPLFCLYDLLGMLVCATRNLGALRAFSLAKLDALRLLPAMLRKRREIRQRSRLSGWRLMRELVRDRLGRLPATPPPRRSVRSGVE